MLSPDARCKFGDASANGYVRSEGAGIVVLKPLAQSLADNDPIYALIRGGAINSDGRSSELLVAPGQDTQMAMLQAAYRNAGISPKELSYVEAHGTGTKAGDRVEIQALGKVLGEGRPSDRPCVIGSVKTNIGHTEAASGVAGLIKTALSLKHRSIPASLHFETPTPTVPWSELPLVVQQSYTEWPKGDGPAFAGVNSFGVTGTNAHVVLQEPPPEAALPASFQQQNAYLIPLSAHSPEALRDLARTILDEGVNESLANVGYTTALRRTHHNHRLALIAKDPQTFTEQLSAFLRNDPATGVVSGQVTADQELKTVFVFPGQGSQWLGMGRELLQAEPVFQQTLAQCEEAMHPFVDWSLQEQLELDESDPAYRLNQINVIQPTLLSIEIALAAQWRSWGLEPDAVIGHSMGEVGAAYVAGALSLEDAMRVICHRSQLLCRTSGQGAMAMVELTIADAEQAITGYEDYLSIAVSNSPRSTVLSGDPMALDEVLAQLEARDVFCRLIKVDVASHSPQMDPLTADLLAALDGLQPRAASVPIYSTALGEVVDGSDFTPGYWVRNLRRPVLFSRMVQHLLTDGHTIFIEMSPHPILLPAVQQGQGDHELLTLASMHRRQPEQATLLASLGKLYVRGYAVDWQQIYPTGRVVALPAYPWQRERFWYETQLPASKNHTGGHPFLHQYVATAAGAHAWQGKLSGERHPYLLDHRVGETAVLPAAATIDMVLSAARTVFDDASITVSNLHLRQAVVIPAKEAVTLQLIITPDTLNHTGFELHSRDSEAAEWVLCAEGLLRNTAELPDVSLPAEQPKHEAASHQQRMARRDLHYGPAFQGLGAWQKDKSQVVADVTRPATAEDGAYFIHPTVLDAAIQALVAALPGDSQTVMPVQVGAIAALEPVAVEGRLRAFAHLTDELRGDVYLFNESDQLQIAVTGLQLQPLGGGAMLSDEWFYELAWQERPLPPEPAMSPLCGCWLIITDERGVGTALAQQLHESGATVETINPDDDVAAVMASDDWQGIVHLAALNGETADLTPAVIHATQKRADLTLLKVLQALPAQEMPPRLWIVTSRAHSLDGEPVNVEQSSVWGLARVIRHEYPHLRCTTVDLEVPTAETLWAELLANDEEQIVYRHGKRYGARLFPWLPPEAEAVKQETADSYRVHVAQPGMLDSLQLLAVPRRQPGVSEVEVAVEVAGLNFIDVMKAMDIYPGLDPEAPVALGAEVAGRVTAVGPGVDGWQVGDAVLAITPSFTDTSLLVSHVTLPAELVLPIPDGLGMAEAATLPIAYLTAYYALHYLGRLETGERVLIHSASGGVGLAAVQLAQMVGAEIFATAGSPEKRDYLRGLGIEHVMDSRSLDFAREIMTITGGEGVDVVLNSLAGEAIPASLSVLTPYGRFLEIGKRDIYQNRRLGLEPFKRNLSFFAIDLSRVIAERPSLATRCLRQVLDYVRSGALRPLPYQTFAAEAVGDAFHHMAQARHIGKLVLDFTADAVRATVPPIRGDATYLITGGTGGLGLTTADWLVDQGARYLVLASRSGADGAARDVITRLERRGASVTVALADISNASTVTGLLHQIAAEQPPLRGVVHAAGLLDDATLAQMTPEQFWRVQAPKVDGAWHLHTQTRNLPLDFFWLYSSVASVIGSPGQGNYAAANAFLDGLAQQRQAQGLPALSINWGPWAEVGLAADRADRGGRLAARWLGSLTPSHGPAAPA
jgi:acyl transferase domain-containing protein